VALCVKNEARRNMNVPVLEQIEDKETQPGVTVATQ